MTFGIRILGGLLVSLLLLGGTLWWLNQEKPKAEPISYTQEKSPENELIEVPLLKTANETLSDQALKFTIDVHYPSVHLLQNPLYAKEANDVINGFVDTITDEFKRNVNETNLSYQGNALGGDYTSDLTMRFTPLLLSPTIISLRFDVSEYYAGAAHPNNYARVLNYHFNKHQLLSTQDLFASSTQTFPFLSEYSRSALRGTFSDVSEEEFALQVFPGTATLAENWRTVGITKNGLTVIFNPYQVAPYARGIPEVKIPLRDIESYISDEVAEAIRMAEDNILEAEPE